MGVKMKTCSKCGETKPLSEFYRDRGAGDGRACRCKVCVSTQRREAYSTGRRDQRADYGLRTNYGSSLAGYDQMLEDQGNGCAICGKTPEENGKRLCVDHNHETGEVRGLLCIGCNNGIGLLQDDIAILLSAVNYLRTGGQ